MQINIIFINIKPTVGQLYHFSRTVHNTSCSVKKYQSYSRAISGKLTYYSYYCIEKSNEILSKQIQSVRAVRSMLDLEPPTWRIVQRIRIVHFILVWNWNSPYTEQLLRFTIRLLLHWKIKSNPKRAISKCSASLIQILKCNYNWL